MSDEIDELKRLKEENERLKQELAEVIRGQIRFRDISRGGYSLRLKDDGYRIYFQVLESQDCENVDPAEWICWAEYKHCDLPGPAITIANELMVRDDEQD